MKIKDMRSDSFYQLASSIRQGYEFDRKDLATALRRLAASLDSNEQLCVEHAAGLLDGSIAVKGRPKVSESKKAYRRAVGTLQQLSFALSVEELARDMEAQGASAPLEAALEDLRKVRCIDLETARKYYREGKRQMLHPEK
jgi:hypothetical protein